MSQISNIVVKKADGTTDYTYVAVSASPGDGGFAQFEGQGPTRASKATLRMRSVWNKAKTARKVDASGMYPLVATDTTLGQPKVVSMVPFEFTFTLPSNVDDATAADAAAVQLNALGSTLFKNVCRTGYAPT